jgi:hypothetical protein
LRAVRVPVRDDPCGPLDKSLPRRLDFRQIRNAGAGAHSVNPIDPTSEVNAPPRNHDAVASAIGASESATP